MIRDGWGENPNPAHDPFNAIKLAHTPVADRLMRDFPHTLIKTSGLDVGLPEGTMGNSEVGHQNIGAGRVVDQESVAITRACREGRLADNTALVESITRARDANHAVHLLGICSDAGVHGQLEHLYAILDLCKSLKAPAVYVHLFTDGRDTGPNTGLGYIEQVEAKLAELSTESFRPAVASVVGRYWAMDRDNRWDRTARAYACLTGRTTDTRNSPPHFPSAAAAVRHAYDNPAEPTMTGDEFVPPSIISNSRKDAMRTRIADGDTVIFYNYRGDRPRQLSAALVFPDTDWANVPPSPDSGTQGFDRGPKLDIDYVIMTAYSEQLATLARVAFPKPPRMVNIAGAYLSGLGLTQFRCAETEKFAHVTFFFNDSRDEPFEGEHRTLVQSPSVSTYDQQPEMSAAGIRDAVLERLAPHTADDPHHCEDVFVINFANGDMVGHTGNLDAAIKACETVDACVGALVDAALARNGSLIITADHGNAEQMKDPKTGKPHTAHTTYDVPLIVVGTPDAPFAGKQLRPGGRLADIIPTALEMMGLPQPPEMTGRSLLA
ncbi:MAG: 2,3-bisphosphoglycerate-independent phosphoglycerate mutase [Planctomycetota bacterium]|nr:2,3-bisphosphoglycerate-independent phosphoglycerate mutase [Planctomycetota bacterium]